LLKEKLLKYKNTPVTVKASIAYTFCSIFQKCLSFITLPLFTRLLTTEEYGQFNIYTSWQGILTIFLTLNLPYGSFSKAMIKFENGRNQYVASCETICLFLSLLFLVIYLPFCNLWNQLFELPTYLVLVLTAEILMQTSILFWSGKKRFEYKYKSVISVTLIIVILSPLLAYVMVMNMTEKGYARILGYAIIYILIGGIFFIYNFIKSGKLFDKNMIKYALCFNLPLIIYYLSQVIFNMSDRIMISHLEDTGKAGIYGVAYSLSMILVFVLNAINNSYVPWFYERLRDGNTSENKKISLIIAVIMSSLLIGVIWIAPEIIQIMAGEKYMEAIWVVPPVAMSNILLLYTQYCINVEFFFEQKRLLVISSIASAIINVALNALLIPVFGFVAAGYTTLFSYVVFLACNYWAMKKIIRENNLDDDMYDKKKLLLLLGAFTLVTAMGMLLYKLVLVRFAIIVIVLILMFLLRRKITPVVKQVFQLKKGVK
jgi:O-antigen/teichoic acid export membrane protein